VRVHESRGRTRLLALEALASQPKGAAVLGDRPDESVRSILAMAVPGENLSAAVLDPSHLDRWPATPVIQVATGAYAVR